MNTITAPLLVVRAFSPKPPCGICHGTTLAGECGAWRCWSDDETGEPRAVWFHLSCIGAPR